MTPDEARARARTITYRLRAANAGLVKYTDGQLWQAVLDAKTTDGNFVALEMLNHIMHDEDPPEALQVYGPGFDGFERWATEQDRCGISWSYYDVARNFKQAQVVGRRWCEAWRREHPR